MTSGLETEWVHDRPLQAGPPNRIIIIIIMSPY